MGVGAPRRRGVAGGRYGGRVSGGSPAAVRALDLDLEVFSGPFDLLLALVLREEIDLLELQLAEVVLAYLDHLERAGELDLESATEFIVLIAALLELKSRLMLAGEDEELLDIEPGEAAEELLARMLDARRYRGRRRPPARAARRRAGRALPRGAAARRSCAARCCRRPTARRTRPSSAPRSGGCWRCPPQIDVRHIAVARVSVAERLTHLRELLRRGSFSFEEAVRGADRMTVAVTLFALLELYKRGEAAWEQSESFGEIAVSARTHEPQLTVARVTRGGRPDAPAGAGQEDPLKTEEEVPA